MNAKSQPPPEKSQSFWSTLPGILAKLAALIVAITGLLALFLHQRHGGDDGSPTPVPSPTFTATPAPWLTVLDIKAKTKEQSDGRYFDFKASELERILGRPFFHGERFLAARRADEPSRPILVFRGSSGGPGDAQGRYEDWHPKDWKPGDHVYVFPER